VVRLHPGAPRPPSRLGFRHLQVCDSRDPGTPSPPLQEAPERRRSGSNWPPFLVAEIDEKPPTVAKRTGIQPLGPSAIRAQSPESSPLKTKRSPSSTVHAAAAVRRGLRNPSFYFLFVAATTAPPGVWLSPRLADNGNSAPLLLQPLSTIRLNFFSSFRIAAGLPL